ncbi:AAA family ATPase [Streptomyces sp. NPDC005526]|uniref:AAA family ATPase n=1 Tax=Streptomyces sp. NPDC005526 TaxID=3156885 RepID=UPI0033A365D4
MAACAVNWTSHDLRETYGFPLDVIEEPTADQLAVMLEVMNPVLARCALYGLIHPGAEELPAAGIASENRARLFAAADREPPPDADRIGASLAEERDGAVRPSAADDGEEKTEHRMTTGGGQEEETGSVASVDQARSARTELKSAGSELERALTDVAAAVSEGKAPGARERLVESLSEWIRGREELARAVASLDGSWPVEAGYAELEDELDRLDRVRIERAQNLTQLEKLRRRSSQYEQMITDADSEAEAGLLQTALDEIRGKIAHLSDGLGRTLPKADSVAPAMPAGESPADQPDKRVTAFNEVSEVALGDGAAVSGEGLAASLRKEESESSLVADPVSERHPGPPVEHRLDDVLASEEDEQPGQSRDDCVPQDGQSAYVRQEKPRSVPPVSLSAMPKAPTGRFSEDESSAGAKPAVGDQVLPWSTGGRISHVTGLVDQVKLPHAYWMTKASDEPEHRAQALSFLSAAFACVGVDGATQVQMAHDISPADLLDDREAYLTATAAALRSGLTAGWPHALVSDFSMPSGLSVPWQQLLTVLVTAVRECHTYAPGSAEEVPEAEQRLTMKDIEESARLLLEDLPRRKIKYQRASRVLQYLTGPSGELCQALRTVIDWARGTGDGSALRTLSEDLRRADHVDRLVEDADSRFRTPKQAKEPIHSGALRQLRTTIRSVSELVTKAEAMAATAGDREAASGPKVPQLDEVLAGVRSYEIPAGVGGAALGLLRKWLTSELLIEAEAAAGAEDDSALPSDDCLLLVPDLPRDVDGNPDFTDPRTAHAMVELLDPLTPDAVLTTYLDRGDLHLARALVRFVEKAHADDGGASDEWLEEAGRRRREAEKVWRGRTAERHREAATHLAQIRTLNLMPPDKEREFTGRLQQFADGDEAGRYQYALDTLGTFVSELTELVVDSTRRLRERLDTLKLDPEHPLSDHDQDRILRLIDEGDTVTAQEFLALAEGGERLPDRPEHDGAELREFLAGLSGPGAPVSGGDGVPAGWWADRYGSGTKLTPNGEKGLTSWNALCSKRGRNSEWSRHIPEVLRLLGLTPTGSFHAEKAGQGVRRFKGRATVTEGAGYVAALGSRATSYTILLIWEEQRSEGPLAHLDAADVDANIVLYLHPLGPDGRRTLTEASRRMAQQALVVDPAVIGWMAARSPGAFGALQRVTLPWASYDPYTPFVAGAVPAEVFYGRDKELREVMNPEGGLFLYGGRQLGKSALLRRVAELFPSRSDSNVAVYLDLVKAEVGQAEAPERIWKLLADDLKRQDVLDPKKVSERAGPDVVVNAVRNWLDEDGSRRLLILADEADAFLTADSRRIFHSGGESTFQNVKRFQDLMEQTDRRLKVVFAGLHQVQRFGELSNVSTAHGGPDVLVGPLNPSAAVQLVTEPMAALGFVFERPELVWRILAITNYQANLVQIFCSELVRSLQDRPQRGHARPTRITEADVQEVAASETVRRRLAERLRFTINLEDRYRVLTLVIALRSLADGYRGDYSANQLLGWAQEAWPEGFQGLGMKQVQIYLMEMVGLGLLVQLGDRSRFAVRSPNVVNMLGTREELELELSETEFSQPYEYDPRAARRLLGRDPGSTPQRYVARYSPLTEGQLHEAAQPGVTVIGTTPLYRPELMLAATERFADARGVEVRRAPADENLRSVLTAASRLRKSYVLALNLRGADEAGLAEALRACVDHAGPAADTLVRQTEGRKRSTFRSVFVVADALAVGALQERRGEAQLPVRFLRPERWSVESLRAWPECPFVSGDERTRLIQVTGGWAGWVELAIAEVTTNGATLDSALELVARRIEQPDNLDRHCEMAGLERQDLDLLSQWSGYVSEGEGVSRDEVATAVELPEEDAESWLVRLDQLGVLEAVEGGLAVDRVTFRAVRARAFQG